MAKTKREPVKASNIFHCVKCAVDLDGAMAMKAHLTDVHQITEHKGKRSMTMHLDCADSYMSTFEWDIAGLKFIQSTCNPRRPR